MYVRMYVYVWNQRITPELESWWAINECGKWLDKNKSGKNERETQNNKYAKRTPVKRSIWGVWWTTSEHERSIPPPLASFSLFMIWLRWRPGGMPYSLRCSSEGGYSNRSSRVKYWWSSRTFPYISTCSFSKPILANHADTPEKIKWNGKI